MVPLGDEPPIGSLCTLDPGLQVNALVIAPTPEELDISHNEELEAEDIVLVVGYVISRLRVQVVSRLGVGWMHTEDLVRIR
jgi:hypothetical protein